VRARARRALQSFQLCCSDAGRCRRDAVLSWNSRPVQSSKPAHVAPTHWFCAPASPLALAPALRFSASELHRSHLSDLAHPLFELRVPPEFSTARPSRRPQSTSSSHGLCFPSAHAGFGDPPAAGVACARYVPPSGFGYPLGGFRPPSPRRPYLVPAALLGFALRSFHLPEGIRYLSARKNPHTVSPTVIPLALRRKAGPVGRGFWASALPGVPRGCRVISTDKPPDTPLGFSPSGL
jgi:hypothetical protein